MTPATEHTLELVQDRYHASGAAWCEPTRYVCSGDQVLVLLRESDGGELAHLWTVRDEIPVGYRVFEDQLEALSELEGSSTLQAV